MVEIVAPLESRDQRLMKRENLTFKEPIKSVLQRKADGQGRPDRDRPESSWAKTGLDWSGRIIRPLRKK